MLLFKWVVPGELAVSSMPSEGDVDSITSTFKSVVVLAEEHELLYNPRDLVKRAVQVIYRPMQDFRAPNLVYLHDLVDLVCSCEKPVLVHCYGGRGRSGVAAVAYLMATEGLGCEEALERARRVEPAFVETMEQHRALWLYGGLLEAVPPRLFSKAIEVGRSIPKAWYRWRAREFGRGVGHASKVLELTIELAEELERVGLAQLSIDTRRALYVAALLHDVGVCGLSSTEPDEAHRERSYELILEHREELDRACGCAIAERVALMARYHGAGPVPTTFDKELLTAMGVLRVAEGLDYTFDQSVKRVRIDRRGERLVIRTCCDEKSPDYEANKRRASEKKRLLEEVLGVPIAVE